MTLLPPDPLQVLLSKLTSNPDEAVAVILPVRFEPFTVKKVEEDGVPLTVVKADGVPEVDMVGVKVVTLFGLLVPVVVK